MPLREGGMVDLEAQELLRSEMPAQGKSCRDGRGMCPELQGGNVPTGEIHDPEQGRRLRRTEIWNDK